jgi:hypothetical protein
MHDGPFDRWTVRDPGMNARLRQSRLILEQRLAYGRQGRVMNVRLECTQRIAALYRDVLSIQYPASATKRDLAANAGSGLSRGAQGVAVQRVLLPSRFARLAIGVMRES